jgi:histidinol-phosphate/aromatic aminotransferase/cobyric acid decarboxylase-like protein
MRDQYGLQGGEGVAAGTLDLSTCVNPYGPPPAVLDRIRSLAADVLRRHPWDSVEQVCDAYGRYLGCPPMELCADRGASGIIWGLARLFAGRTLALPLPGYTEYFRAFPDAVRIPGDGERIAVDQLAVAMKAADVVVLANPLNPSGTVIAPDLLTDVARRFPSVTLVVDESYLDFLPDPRRSLVGTGAANVAVIRSPSKFFGMAGVRAGVLWSAHQPLLAAFRAMQDTWPISAVDAACTCEALRADRWAVKTRRRLAADVRWLDSWLSSHDCAFVPGEANFRLVTRFPRELPQRLQALGVRVRHLGAAHGLAEGGWRIAAPTPHNRVRLPEAGQPSRRRPRDGLPGEGGCAELPGGV